MPHFQLTSEIMQTLYNAAGKTKTSLTGNSPRKQTLNSMKNVSMLFGWCRSGGGVLQKWESPYQAIVLSSLMEPPIQNGRAAERFTGTSHDLTRIRTNCSPPLQYRALCLAHTLPAPSLDTNLPLSTSSTLPHCFIFAYRYLWTLFFSSVLFNVTISLLVPSSPLSLSHYGFCSHSAECSVLRPEPLVEDNLHWSICKTVPPSGTLCRFILWNARGKLSRCAVKLLLCVGRKERNGENNKDNAEQQNIAISHASLTGPVRNKPGGVRYTTLRGKNKMKKSKLKCGAVNANYVTFCKTAWHYASHYYGNIHKNSQLIQKCWERAVELAA